MRDKLILKYPVSRGMVTDWDMMEKMFGYILSGLTENPDEYNIMLTEPVINPKDQREKMISIMFETFNVQKFYITDPGKLVLYNNGGFTGMVLDSGEGVTQFIPIVDGYGLPFTNLIEFGGKDLTEYMVRLLNEIKYIPIEKEKEIAKNAKEKACYVSLDKGDISWVENFDYELPDGTNISIKEQRIKCCEALFEPSMAGVDYDDNIAQYCNNCIKKCNEFAQKQLYSNIILSGGNTMFEGFQERLTR
jgi:actin-related protein